MERFISPEIVCMSICLNIIKIKVFKQIITDFFLKLMFSYVSVKVDKRRYRLKDHIKGNHLGNESHTCVLCMRVYRNKNSLTNHMSVYHSKKHEKCT